MPASPVDLVKFVRLLDALPELGEHIESAELPLARRRLAAELIVVEKGSWRPEVRQVEPGYLGLLVLDGLLTRDVVMHEPLATELVGRGDLLRPGDTYGEDAPIPFDVSWQVSHPARLAVLDADFARRAARWPSVGEFVVKGMTSRAHSLAVSMAISRLRHVDLRLLVFLWYLADRWGKVRRDGVCVPLRLTHETLGRLVGARRPSVTTALRELREDKRITRTPEGFWVLHGPPPETTGRLIGSPTDELGGMSIDGQVAASPQEETAG